LGNAGGGIVLFLVYVAMAGLFYGVGWGLYKFDTIIKAKLAAAL
jgi:hypothetical protein